MFHYRACTDVSALASHPVHTHTACCSRGHAVLSVRSSRDPSSHLQFPALYSWPCLPFSEHTLPSCFLFPLLSCGRWRFCLSTNPSSPSQTINDQIKCNVAEPYGNWAEPMILTSGSCRDLKRSCRLQRSEHSLLLQRTWILLPAPIWQLTINCNSKSWNPVPLLGTRHALLPINTGRQMLIHSE